MPAILVQGAPVSLRDEFAARLVVAALRPLQVLVQSPAVLFLAALSAMLLRPPDVSFYEIDRVAFGLLVVGMVVRAIVLRQPVLHFERATWPMLALSLLAVAGVAGQGSDSEAWSLIAAKFIVPFTLFHLAGQVFTAERSFRHFETFGLIVLAYLSFTAMAFLAGATWLIFPRFILDGSLGNHVDRARGPFLQAVANGVSLNLLGLLALHAFRRGSLKGLKAALLIASVPVAILATMTRTVWLTFAATVIVLMIRSHSSCLRRICAGLMAMAGICLLIVMNTPQLRRTLTERLEERGPVEFRRAVYVGSWQMFLERPFTGWGENRMPTELARHVSGYRQKTLYPHNTYLELLVEHGILGLALYVWMMWELLRLGKGMIPKSERHGFLDRGFHKLWPIFLGVYWVNAALVVMNYQFVNGLLFTMAGMMAMQSRQAWQELHDT